MTKNIYNIILTASHVFGIQMFKPSNTIIQNIFYSAILTGSVLMHLSDKKHGLPGISVFGNYHKLFLNIDRITALSGAIYASYKFVELLKSNSLTQSTIFDGIFGLFSLFLSENYHLFYKHDESKIIFHTITHVIWHYYAFKILGHL